MIKYVHISYSGVGGMSEAALSLAMGASRTNSEHSFLFYGKDDVAEKYQEKCDRLGFTHEYIPKGASVDFWGSVKVLRYLKKLSPDRIVCHMTQPFIALFCYRLVNPRVGIVIVEHHSNQLKSAQDWVLTVLNHWICHLTIYLTEEYRATVKRRLGSCLRNRKVKVVGNVIDTSKFRPVERKRPNEKIVIGMQARMVRGKDFETLLRAFELLIEGGRNDIRLELAGDGPNRVALEQLAKYLGIAEEVTFHGMLEQESLIATMQGWDIMVLLTEGETMSRAVMEGQALGLPVVVSNVTGISALIDHAIDGMLVCNNDSSELAKLLTDLIAASNLRSNISKNARIKAVEQFSCRTGWELLCQAIAETFPRNLLAQK